MFIAVAQKKTNAVPQCVQGLRHSLAAIADSAVTIGHDPFFTFHWHRRGEITGQLRKLKALHEKTPGVRNPCSFRTATQTQAVCVWSNLWALIRTGLRLLDSRRWRRRRNYHSLMSPIDTAIRRRTTVKNRRPSTCRVLWTVSYSLSSFPHYRFAVLLALRRFYCFINNISATPRPINNIIHTVLSLCHLLEGSFDRREVFDWGRFIQGPFDRGGKKGGIWPGGNWPRAFDRTPSVTAGIVSKRLNLSYNFFDHLVAPSFKLLWTLAPIPNSKGTHSSGAFNTGGWEKLAISDGNLHLSRKGCEIGRWLQWNVNRKLWVPDWMVWFSMTLSDS